MMRRTLFFATIAVPILLALGYQQLNRESERAYEEGKQILRGEGPSAAHAFFRERVELMGDQLAFFGTAWTAYLEGRSRDAEDICWFLISETEDPIVRAHANYLMGYIATDNRRFDRAFFHFVLARNVYEAEGQPERVYKAVLGLANVAVMNKDSVEAGQYLRMATELADGRDYDLSFLYILKKKQASLRGDYEEALAWSKVVYEISSENEPERFFASNDMAFFSLLTGESEQSLSFLEEAETLQKTLGNPLEQQFLNVSWILYNRCNDRPFEDLIDEVDHWLEEHPRPDLESSFRLVQAWRCQER